MIKHRERGMKIKYATVDEKYSIEMFDDDVCDLFNKYLGVGFVSKNNNQFFDDEDLVADFNYHIEGLKKLIQYTRKVI